MQSDLLCFFFYTIVVIRVSFQRYCVYSQWYPSIENDFAMLFMYEYDHELMRCDVNGVRVCGDECTFGIFCWQKLFLIKSVSASVLY